jgi:MFS family permease
MCYIGPKGRIGPLHGAIFDPNALAAGGRRVSDYAYLQAMAARAGPVARLQEVALSLTPRRAIGVFFFLQGLCAATFVSRIPELKARFHLSDTRLGFAMGLMACGGLVMLPLAGLAVARFGSRRILIAAACCHGLTLASLAQIHTWPLLLVMLGSFGMANTAVQISVNAQAVLAERDLQSSILASMHGLWSIAGFCGALLGMATLSGAVGRGTHFGGVGLAMLISVGACAGHLPCDAGADTLTPDAKKSARLTRGWRPEPYLVRLALLTFGAMFCESAMFDWSGVYFSQWVTADPIWVGLSYSVFMAAMALGRFAADRCVGSVGVERVLPWGGLLLAAGYFLCAALPYRATALLGFALTGLGVCAMVPLIMAQTGRAQATPLGIALAFVSTVGFAGAFLGPFLVGLVADQVNLRVAFAGVGLVGLGIGARAGHVLRPTYATPTGAYGPVH